MVGVRQLLQGIRGARVVFVYMRDLVVRRFVDPCVEQGDHNKADDHSSDHQPDVGGSSVCVQRFRQQVEADHRGHDAGREGKQQTDGFIGILAEHTGDHRAHARSADAGDGRDPD